MGDKKEFRVSSSLEAPTIHSGKISKLSKLYINILGGNILGGAIMLDLRHFQKIASWIQAQKGYTDSSADSSLWFLLF